MTAPGGASAVAVGYPASALHVADISLAACSTLPGFARRNEPVSFGVQLPRGACDNPADVTLVDAGGARLPVQARALERWPDGSSRWVLVDTLVSTDYRGCSTCRLLLDRTPSTSPARAITATTLDGRVVIDTGTVCFTLSRNSPSVIEAVSAAGAALFDSSRSGLRIVGRDGRSYSIRFDRLEVTEQGALRTAVVAEGYARAAGTGARRAELKIRLRFQFFAGTGVVRTAIALTNPNAARHPGGQWDLGDPGSVYLEEASFSLALPGSPTPAVVEFACEARGATQTSDQPVEIVQESSGGANWASPAHRNRLGVVPACFRGYRVTSEAGRASGLRATPTATLRSGSGQLTVLVPQFWQNFPKSLDVESDAITVGLFPRQHRDVHELQGGERKTHVVVAAFGPDRIADAPLAWAVEPLIASVMRIGERLRHTGLDSLSPTTRGEYERLVRSAIDGPAAFDRKREGADEYGWRNFGDLYADHEAVFHHGSEPLISHYNNQYDAIAGFATQFLATGDRRWWQLMADLAAHVVDIDLYHTNRDRAAYNGGYFWHTNHYVDAGTSTHRAYSRLSGSAGGGPSAEHNYTTGLLLHYLMTGSEESREAVLQLADWVEAMDDGARGRFRWIDAGPTGTATATYSFDYHGPGRGAGNSINALVDAHRLTGEARYLRKADAIVRRCIHPDDDLVARNLSNAEARWSYTVFLQALGKYLDYRAERQLFDGPFDYARASLLAYASWALEHERPYLDAPEQLEFPNETWPAQDLRKTALFEYAARYTPDREQCQRFLERAAFFADYAVAALAASDRRSLTRPVVLLLAFAFQRPAADVRLPELPPLRSGNFGRPISFEGYKRRVFRKLVVAGASAAAAVILALLVLLANG